MTIEEKIKAILKDCCGHQMGHGKDGCGHCNEALEKIMEAMKIPKREE